MPSVDQRDPNQTNILKSVRKRRILMKEKCNLIDYQITLNLQKLDSLLGLLQQKKIRFDSLHDILETHIEEEIETLSKKELRKERRLKFKYSTNRQYAFEQNSSTELTAKDKVLETKGDIFFGQSSEEHGSMFIEGLNLQENFISENGQNVTDVSLSTERLQKKSSRLRRYNSLRESEINDQENEIESINIETRYNWIERYLNHELNDTSVKAFNSNGQQIEVIKFNKKEDHFQCKLVQENEPFAMTNITNRSAKSTKSTKKRPFFTQEYLDYKCKDFFTENTEVQIDFPRHTCQVKLFQPEKQQVIRLRLMEKDSSVRILLKSLNTVPSEMQRIIIFKEIPNQTSGQKYKIVWTKYDKQSFIDDIVLESNCNYLITNLCCHPSSELKIILNPTDLHALKIHKTQYDPWRSYNILCSAFEQCSKVFMSENVYDQQKPLEYLRANYLDHGLVLQIYQNVHPQRISITDKKEQKRYEEDIRLLFGEIYSKEQNQNMYEPDELVIKFFEVTEKPARIYYPQKKVLIGNQISEQVTVYSTFK